MHTQSYNSDHYKYTPYFICHVSGDLCKLYVKQDSSASNTFVLYCFCRRDQNSSNANIVVGKPQRGVLSSIEQALLNDAKVTVPSIEVMFYHGLCLRTGVVVTARSQSRMTKRNNTCLLYIDKAQTYCLGILEKIFSFNVSTASGYFCLVSTLSTLPSICADDATPARLQDHFVACQPPWLVVSPCHPMYFLAPIYYIYLKSAYLSFPFQRSPADHHFMCPCT